MNLSVGEQKEIFTQLAKEFVNYEIISEEGSFIKDLFLEVILKNKIDEYMDRYARCETKPLDQEEFAMKLVRHALMDRIKPDSNKIGFINEFVFGTFIAEALITGVLDHENQGLLDPKYISIATSAFAVESIEKREKLYQSIKEIIALLDTKKQLTIETMLLRKIAHSYREDFFERFVFQDIHFTRNEFDSCTFNLCVFKNCEIDIGLFKNCTFINCNFYHIDKVETKENKLTSYFSGCVGAEIFGVEEREEEPQKEDEDKIYKKIVLENFWNPGKPKADSRRSASAIFRGTPSQDRHRMTIAIEALIREGYLSFGSDYYHLNHDKMADIMKILGRLK